MRGIGTLSLRSLRLGLLLAGVAAATFGAVRVAAAQSAPELTPEQNRPPGGFTKPHECVISKLSASRCAPSATRRARSASCSSRARSTW